MALAILQPVYEAAIARCREREKVLQDLKPAKEAVRTIVLDLFRDHLQDQAVNTDVVDSQEYEALLDEERRRRVSIEDELGRQLMAKEMELHLKEARSKELQMERDELVEQLAEQTRLLELERSSLTSQLQFVQAEQDKLDGQVKEDAGVQRSLIKEFSILLDERDSLLREVSRSASGSPTNARRLQLMDQSPHKREPSLHGFDVRASATATTMKATSVGQALRDSIKELSADIKGTMPDLRHNQGPPPEKFYELPKCTTDAGQSEVAREAAQVTLSSLRAKLGRPVAKIKPEPSPVQHGCLVHNEAPCQHRWGPKAQESTQPHQPPQVGCGRIARPVCRSASDNSRLRGNHPPSSLQPSSKCLQTTKGQGSRYPRHRLLEKENAPANEARPLRPAGAGPAPVAPPGSALSMVKDRPQKKLVAAPKPKPNMLHAGLTELPRSTEWTYERHLQGLLRRMRPAAQ